MSETEVTGPDLVNEGIPIDSLDDNIPVKGQVDGKQVIVVRTESGLCAVAGHCSHYGGPLGDGLCVDGQVHCPWHHATFDLTTGEAVGAPALNRSRSTSRPSETVASLFLAPSMPPLPIGRPPVDARISRDRGVRCRRRRRRRDASPARLHGIGVDDRSRGAGRSPQCLQGLSGGNRPRGLDAVAQPGFLRGARHHADHRCRSHRDRCSMRGPWRWTTGGALGTRRCSSPRERSRDVSPHRAPTKTTSITSAHSRTAARSSPLWRRQTMLS